MLIYNKQCFQLKLYNNDKIFVVLANLQPSFSLGVYNTESTVKSETIFSKFLILHSTPKYMVIFKF